MLTFGIDIMLLLAIGLMHLFVTYMWCKLTCTSQEEGESMLKGVAITVVIMLVGYMLMANALDWIVGV